jgi:hypothetical protein
VARDDDGWSDVRMLKRYVAAFLAMNPPAALLKDTDNVIA